jgi:hypothetical protein
MRGFLEIPGTQLYATLVFFSHPVQFMLINIFSYSKEIALKLENRFISYQYK